MENQKKLEQIDIQNLIKNEGSIRKFQGVAPEGFVLVHEKTLEDLKDFDNWKNWKNNEISIDELNKINFESVQFEEKSEKTQ